MELGKAHIVASRYREYDSLLSSIREMGAMLREGGCEGTASVVLPRRLLGDVVKLLECELERVRIEIDAL